MEPRLPAGTPLTAEDAQRLAAALAKTDKVERVLEAAMTRREDSLKPTRRRDERADTP